MNWKQTLKEMKLHHMKKTSPAFFEASGGYETEVKSYKDDSANMLSRCVIDFLKFKDYQVKRLSNSSIDVDQFDRFNVFGQTLASMAKPRNISKLLQGSIFISAVHSDLELLIQIKAPTETCQPGSLNGFIKIHMLNKSVLLELSMPIFMTWYSEERNSTLNQLT